MKGYISKSEELNKIIELLYQVQSEADYENICCLFDEVYLDETGNVNEQFRHEYSSISGKIRELNEVELEGQKVYIADYLVENINRVYDYALKCGKPYINNLFKLKDHIGLEVGRILLVEQLEWRISNGQESVASQLEYMGEISVVIGNQIQQSQGLLNELQMLEKENQDNIAKAQKSLEDLEGLSDGMKQKVEEVQKDSITILGIFASIVLSFTAGMVFSSSVLENIDKASPYRLVGTVLLIGAVLTNLIALLLIYIDRLRMVKAEKIVFPKCVKVMNVCYVLGFIADFAVWLILEKLTWIWQ